MLQLKDNPPMTWSDVESLDAIREPWTVVYCKPRQEKALAWDLRRNLISYFLPMVMRETSSGGRRRRNLYPMFKSYLFFAGNEDARLVVQKTNRLVQLVDIDQAEQTSFQREISSLELALRTAPEEIELHPHIVKGNRVIIISGPMVGTEGVILNADNRTKLWVGVSLMGAGVTVEIHADLVEPIGEEFIPTISASQIEYHVGGGTFMTTTGIRSAARSEQR